MNAEHLLDAMGLLDDDLIQEAETYKKRRPDYRPWISLAACLAIVIVLGYGLTHIGMGGGNSAAPDTAGGAAASAPAGTSQPPSGNMTPEAPSENEYEPQSPGAANGNSQDYCPAIMVGGTLYWSTGEAIPVEVDESAIQTVTAYINTVPQMDGQTNFSPDLSARYAQISEGLVVLMDGEWVLFDPVPPWER